MTDSLFELAGPLLQAGQVLSDALELLSSGQNRSGAVGEQHAQVAVAQFGDPAKSAFVAGAVFAGCQAQSTGEVTTVRKMVG